MAHFRLALLLLVVTLAATAQQPARPPEDSLDLTHLGESNQLGTRFRNAEARAAQGQWAEAIEEYQRILVEVGDELAPVDKRHVVQARWLAQARLSALPPEALTLYRSRIDPPAKKLLELGRGNRDSAPLQRIVDESFCSSYTDQAVDLLGDLAFERGEFEEAEQFWRMVVRPASRQSAGLDTGFVVAGPKIDVAAVRAKQILAQLFRGETGNLTVELRDFATAHPGAKGRLAGKQGVYVDLLKELAANPANLGMPTGPGSWGEFAGAASRNRVLPRVEGRLAHLPCVEGPAWQVRLDGGQKAVRPVEPLGADKMIVSWTEASRWLGYYPVISDDRVIVANSHAVTAYQISTGEPKFNYSLDRDRNTGIMSKPGVEPDVAFPLTVVGERIYARLGSKAAGPPRSRRPFGRRGGFNMDMGGRDPDPQTFLVCLTMQPNLGPQERWYQTPPPAAGEQGAVVAFEGAPIVHQDRVYIAVTKFPPGQTQTFLACYDTETGTLRWERKVCEAPELKEGESRSRHHLLTLAGQNIVYCSHSGAIVAIDALTGQPRWGVRYPSRGPKMNDGQASFRSLAPCCYADGRVYVAPLDLDHLICLDSRTGQTLWESDPLEIAHILGVSHGKVFCTTVSPRCGIRALDAATGSSQGGWMQPGDDSKLPTFGRGLLAGDLVFWPTRKGLNVLRQSDGEPVALDPEIRGNLAAADGCLIVADSRVLSAYPPDKWTLRRRTQEAAQDGASALTVYRLALAEVDAGQTARALTTLERALEMAQTQRQKDLALAKIHEVLLQSARTASRGGDWKKAEALLIQAASKRFPASERVRTVALCGLLAEEHGKFDEAVNAWQTILETPELRDASFSTGEKMPERACAIAGERIDRLLRQHGRAIYSAIEQRAEKLARMLADQQETLDRLGQEFPHALATMRMLEERARVAEKNDKPWEAATSYRALLDLPESSLNRMILLAGLTRAYERQNCWEAARSSLYQMECEGANRLEALIHPVLNIREWVAERRKGLPVPPNPRSAEGPLFSRHWQATWEADGIGLLSEAGDNLFRVAGTNLECLQTGAGKKVWTREISFPARWLGLYADLMVVAGDRDMICVRQGDGSTAWRQSFTRSASAPLHGFQIAGGRLCFFVGTDRFSAWDVVGGRCLWCDWAPGSRLGLESPDGCFAEGVLAGSNRAVLTTGHEKPIVLDSKTGSRLDKNLDLATRVQTHPSVGNAPWTTDRARGHSSHRFGGRSAQLEVPFRGAAGVGRRDPAGAAARRSHFRSTRVQLWLSAGANRRQDRQTTLAGAAFRRLAPSQPRVGRY